MTAELGTNGKHVPGLATTVQRLHYDWSTGAGGLFMPDGCCTDMQGAIRLFRKIDPNVRVIRTFAGPARDTTYERVGRDEWVAVDPHGGRWGPHRLPAHDRREPTHD